MNARLILVMLALLVTFTAVQAPAQMRSSSQYADVSSSDLAPGASTSAFTLTFSNPLSVQIKYKPRVLATTVPR
jgi:hypothetical protein